jgi:hypothetical protein
LVLAAFPDLAIEVADNGNATAEELARIINTGAHYPHSY